MVYFIQSMNKILESLLGLQFFYFCGCHKNKIRTAGKQYIASLEHFVFHPRPVDIYIKAGRNVAV